LFGAVNNYPLWERNACISWTGDCLVPSTTTRCGKEMDAFLGRVIVGAGVSFKNLLFD
jgi:hypothetical protein